ncbi:MAG TPA: SRPBCC domain-containing protein [Steroidobacteraceae bacterium]|nr:SRPBCC domain-containing protein [Steroidobacteraceae bacterium]
MARRTRGYAHRIDIAAGTARIWSALTSVAELREWCSPAAQIVAREGGLFRASVDRLTEQEAHIDVLLPPRRMRLIYLPSPQLPQTDTAIVDDFMLDPAGDRTVLRLLGSGFPPDEAWDTTYLRLRVGWERALARLKARLEHPGAI